MLNRHHSAVPWGAFLAGFTILLVFSYALALIEEPQSYWLWCRVLEACA